MWILQQIDTGYLNDEQLAQVKVLFNALQPGDKSRRIPSAEMAGAHNFVHLLLARDENIYFEIPAWRKLYTDSLALLDVIAHQRFNKALKELDQSEASAIILDLEKQQLQGLPQGFSQDKLFKTLLRHCIQGCFSDPRWGGNKDKIMWKWYGYQQETREVI